MSEITATRQAPSTRGRALGITSWIMQAVLALGFIPGGFMKVTGEPIMVDMFADIGVGQWFRYLVGALEIAGGIAVLVPRVYGLAALGLVGIMAGATVTNLFVLDQAPWVPLAYLAMAALVAWIRWPQTRALLAGTRR